jgi:hypothetical protein
VRAAHGELATPLNGWAPVLPDEPALPAFPALFVAPPFELFVPPLVAPPFAAPPFELPPLAAPLAPAAFEPAIPLLEPAFALPAAPFEPLLDGEVPPLVESVAEEPPLAVELDGEPLPPQPTNKKAVTAKHRVVKIMRNFRLPQIFRARTRRAPGKGDQGLCA